VVVVVVVAAFPSDCGDVLFAGVDVVFDGVEDDVSDEVVVFDDEDDVGADEDEVSEMDVQYCSGRSDWISSIVSGVFSYLTTDSSNVSSVQSERSGRSSINLDCVP
jgi:hypothetical protein